MNHNLKTAICKLASDLGFDLCGFASAEAPLTAQHFLAWLAKGYHATMNYLARTAPQRTQPTLVLPGAKTVIVLGVSYAGPENTRQHADHNPEGNIGSGEPGAFGLVARYARFRDYHRVLHQHLKEFIVRINRLGAGDTRSVGYVDTGPVLERDCGWRGGIGFFGKHTNLISPKLGNWFFLAEVLTTIEIQPDTPRPNRCGSCNRCVAACPTGALVDAFQLNASRCISYLTIELRGTIPAELRPYIGNRVFGCDSCLEVCPWNRFARPPNLMKPYKWSENGQLDLIGLLTLDDEGFKKMFGNTPLARAKLQGLKRNACVAAGNAGDPRALPVLEKLAANSDHIVAEHARWAIDRIRQRFGAGRVERKARNERSEDQ